MGWNRYGKKTTLDGIVFDSKLEARCFSKLKIALQEDLMGLLEIELQPKLKPLIEPIKRPIVEKAVRAMTYTPDFLLIFENGHNLYVDAKGWPTPEYKIKRKLLISQIVKGDHGDIHFAEYKKVKKTKREEIVYYTQSDFNFKLT